MIPMDRKAFKTARAVNWSCIPANKPDEQNRYSAVEKMVCFPSLETFSEAITLPQRSDCLCVGVSLTASWNALIKIHAFYFLSNMSSMNKW